VCPHFLHLDFLSPMSIFLFSFPVCSAHCTSLVLLGHNVRCITCFPWYNAIVSFMKFSLLGLL
jgi:hypothetical protein